MGDTAVLRFTCPNCQKRVRAKREFAGRRIRCPNSACHQPFIVPLAEESDGELNHTPEPRRIWLWLAGGIAVVIAVTAVSALARSDRNQSQTPQPTNSADTKATQPDKGPGEVAASEADDKPKHNTLTDRKKADGWILLFDGKETKGWKVDGEAKVVDGMLIVGGAKAVKLKTAGTFGKFELRFEYRKERKGFPHIMDLPLFGAGKDKTAVWNEVTLTAERKTIRVVDKEPGVGIQNVKIDLFAERDKTPVDFEVPAETKLLLRNIKLKKQ